MQTVYGIAGPAGAGKDTFAGYLCRSLLLRGSNVQVRGFADPIRALAEATGFDMSTREAKEQPVVLDYGKFETAFFEAINTVLGNMLGETQRAALFSYCSELFSNYRVGFHGIEISPRTFMQIVGTEGGQRITKTLWADIASRDHWGEPNADYVLVPDFRFIHEAKYLHHIFVMHRPDVAPVHQHSSEDLARTLQNSAGSTHNIPELCGKPIQHIYNDKSLEALHVRAKQIADLVMWNDHVRHPRT